MFCTPSSNRSMSSSEYFRPIRIVGCRPERLGLILGRLAIKPLLHRVDHRGQFVLFHSRKRSQGKGGQPSCQDLIGRSFPGPHDIVAKLVVNEAIR